MKKPVLLNGKGGSKSLDVAIGGLKLELWDFEKTGERAFVRLSLISREEDRREDEATDTAAFYVDLDAMQGDALAVALGRWERSLDSELPHGNDPSMRLRIGTLSIVAHGRHDDQDAYLELKMHANILPATATLTRLEADVLGRLLESLIGEESGEKG